MIDKVPSIILRAINRLGRVRDAVYLDTNAWSALAKGEFPHEPLAEWLKQNGCYLWMARFQAAELARDTRIARPLAEVLRTLPVIMLDRGQNEFSGAAWHKVETECDDFIRLDRNEMFDEFVYQLTSGPIRDTRDRLDKDAEAFRLWLDEALASIPPNVPRSWSEFPKRLETWIRSKCLQNDVPVHEPALADPEYYVGLRLSYGVLFLRYFINGQRWQRSDYLDYLHAADMAYARVVVTEKNLAECIRQLAKRPEVTAPEIVADLSWLRNPIT